MDVAAIIAQAQEGATPESEASKEATPVEENSQEQAPQDDSEEVSKKPDEELTKEQLEKREANRRSHQNSREARLRRENRELRQYLEQLSAQKSQQQPVNQNSNEGKPVKPTQDQFSDWESYEAAKDDYYEKLADWKAEQKLTDRDKKYQESAKAQAGEAYKAERVQEISKQTEKFAAKVPEYNTLVTENADFFENMPPHVEQALLEAEKTHLAVFALMKEGRLYDLENMSPYRLAMEIGKAEMRGESYLNQKRVTNAPEPVQAAKGTGSASRPMDKMSIPELMKRFNK